MMTRSSSYRLATALSRVLEFTEFVIKMQQITIRDIKVQRTLTLQYSLLRIELDRLCALESRLLQHLDAADRTMSAEKTDLLPNLSSCEAHKATALRQTGKFGCAARRRQDL